MYVNLKKRGEEKGGGVYARNLGGLGLTYFHEALSFSAALLTSALSAL